MYVVTGAAGFIGSHLVKALNERGTAKILAVDAFADAPDAPNLRDCRVAACMDRADFRRALRKGTLPRDIRAILHQGACADTLQTDRDYMMDNNFAFSVELLDHARARGLPFIYASSAAVYGTHRDAAEVPDNEEPVNLYAASKLAFDNHVRPLLAGTPSPLVGLRYFNVYGAREVHKGRMASMVFQIVRQLLTSGVVRLFEGTDGFANGEQRRDFIHVDDAIAANLFFLDAPPVQGIFNVGTGTSRSFNEVARTAIALLGSGRIEYIPFPAALEGRYQSFTEADLERLRQAGFDHSCKDLRQGIGESLPAWRAFLESTEAR